MEEQACMKRDDLFRLHPQQAEHLIYSFNRRTSRPRTRARSAVVSGISFGGSISNSLCTKSFNRIEAARSRIIRTRRAFRWRWWWRRWCHKSSHIWSPHDAVSRRSVRCWSCRRASRSQSDLRHDFGHSILGRSSSNDTVSICNYNVLKLIHEDSSKVVVGEHTVKHVQLPR